jgi:hypothetical protein
MVITNDTNNFGISLIEQFLFMKKFGHEFIKEFLVLLEE